MADISLKARGHAAPPDLGVPEVERRAIAEGLTSVLADTYALYWRTHLHHWNVTGPWFATLHRVFEEQYNELWMAVDLIAERIRALGAKVPGAPDALSKKASLTAEAGPDAEAMVAELVAGHEACIRTIRAFWPAVEAATDQTTLDLLGQRMSVHEKTAWMLRSLLE